MLLMSSDIYKTRHKDIVLPLVTIKYTFGELDKDTWFLTKSKFRNCYLFIWIYMLSHL